MLCLVLGILWTSSCTSIHLTTDCILTDIYADQFFCLSSKLSVMSILQTSAIPFMSFQYPHAVLLSWVGWMLRVFSDLVQSNQFWGGTGAPGVPRTILGKALVYRSLLIM